MKLWRIATYDSRCEDISQGESSLQMWFRSRAKALAWAIEMTRQTIHAAVLDLPEWAIDSVKEDMATPIEWVLWHVVVKLNGESFLALLNDQGFIERDLLNVEIEITKDGRMKTLPVKEAA